MVTTGTVDLRVRDAVAAIDAWLETVRGPRGYGGPVVHWWQQCLTYTGPGFDWRYEGIIAGYLTLWERTGDERWLGKACRAADDVVAGQLPSGHFAASAFELNPAAAGTPGEAAADVGLLLLGLALRSAGREGWERYVACAERNLRAFHVGQLWDPEARAIQDGVATAAFVPNKAATAAEALILLSEATGESEWAEAYGTPTLDRVVEHQVRDGGLLDGAIAQNSFGRRVVRKYFPYYTARCVPGLLLAHRVFGRDRYVEAALAAMRFVARWTRGDGSPPTVVYPDGRTARFPSWIAALGDVLRAADLVREHGFDADLTAMRSRLLAGLDATGGIRTATGFAGQATGRVAEAPDVRDVLPVAGWVDKAFRYLAAGVVGEVQPATSGSTEVDCVFRGKPVRYRETPEAIEVRAGTSLRYRWRKGDDWAAVAEPEFWLK